MASDLIEAELRRRAEGVLRSFDFAPCADHRKRYGRSAGNVAARLRDVGAEEHDLRATGRKLLALVCRGDPDGVKYSASGGLLALRDGQELRLFFVAEEAVG